MAGNPTRINKSTSRYFSKRDESGREYVVSEDGYTYWTPVSLADRRAVDARMEASRSEDAAEEARYQGRKIGVAKARLKEAQAELELERERRANATAIAASAADADAAVATAGTTEQPVAAVPADDRAADAATLTSATTTTTEQSVAATTTELASMKAELAKAKAAEAEAKAAEADAKQQLVEQQKWAVMAEAQIKEL